MSWRILLAAAGGALALASPLAARQRRSRRATSSRTPAPRTAPARVAHRRQARRLDDDRQPLDL